MVRVRHMYVCKVLQRTQVFASPKQTLEHTSTPHSGPPSHPHPPPRSRNNTMDPVAECLQFITLVFWVDFSR